MTITNKKSSIVDLGRISRPRLSEKAVASGKLDKFVFEVDSRSNKVEIRKALESFYGIDIARLNVINLPGKNKRNRYGYFLAKKVKKVVVTLKPGSSKPGILDQ